MFLASCVPLLSCTLLHYDRCAWKVAQCTKKKKMLFSSSILRHAGELDLQPVLPASNRRLISKDGVLDLAHCRPARGQSWHRELPSHSRAKQLNTLSSSRVTLPAFSVHSSASFFYWFASLNLFYFLSTVECCRYDGISLVEDAKARALWLPPESPHVVMEFEDIAVIAPLQLKAQGMFKYVSLVVCQCWLARATEGRYAIFCRNVAIS